MPDIATIITNAALPPLVNSIVRSNEGTGYAITYGDTIYADIKTHAQNLGKVQRSELSFLPPN